MSPIKSIIVHADASPRSSVRLMVARQLADEHDAALTAVFAVTSSFLEYPSVLGADGEAAVLFREIDDDRRRRARSIFDEAAAGAGRPVSWVEISGGAAVPALARCALHADMLVMGQHDPDAGFASGTPADLVESVLIASGRPALIVPYVGEVHPVPRNVLVAWKSTRETARALTSAIPLMHNAKEVHVTTFDEEEPAHSPGSNLEVGQYLKLHGIDAKLHRYGSAEGEVGESLLSLTADLGSDLLVMGCYGHSRARELVLGGASRVVLRSMTVPTLMSH